MNFPNFDKSLVSRRILKGYNSGYYILRAAPEVMRDEPCILPRVTHKDQNITCIETSSYARAPGIGTSRLEDFIKNQLPADFEAFYQKYAEALVVTRTFPVHLWTIETMIASIQEMRQLERCPIRFVRFGEQWDRSAAQYALWQHTPGLDDWWVVATSREYHDDYFDNENLTDYNLLGYSFKSWLEDWISRDGLPDPLMDLGPEGGFLDPA